MALKIPDNNLSYYLTNRKAANIAIHAMTGITTVELSKLRNGLIKRISAKKLALIVLSINEDIGEAIVEIYPGLSLIPTINKSKNTTPTTLGGYLDSVENNTLKIISSKTGLTTSRLKILKTRANAIPLAHELYLIEMALEEPPGTLFKLLYKDLKLNPVQVQNTLRVNEKLKSSKQLKK